jgi:hypothetical protein
MALLRSRYSNLSVKLGEVVSVKMVPVDEYFRLTG